MRNILRSGVKVYGTITWPLSIILIEWDVAVTEQVKQCPPLATKIKVACQDDNRTGVTSGGGRHDFLDK